MKSSWLKSLGLKGPGLKLGVEKSWVETSFNRFRIFLEKIGTSHHGELVARIPEIIHDSNIKVEVARKGQLSFRH